MPFAHTRLWRRKTFYSFFYFLFFSFFLFLLLLCFFMLSSSTLCLLALGLHRKVNVGIFVYFDIDNLDIMATWNVARVSHHRTTLSAAHLTHAKVLLLQFTSKSSTIGFGEIGLAFTNPTARFTNNVMLLPLFIHNIKSIRF